MGSEYDMSPLRQDEIDALYEALDDEYHSWATYDQVIVDFGIVRPFINIREAEARHIDALRNLFDRYGLSFPENPWVGRVERYSSIAAACAGAVDAEVENGRLYERLLSRAIQPDVRAVFVRLKEASEERHLPAFRRCVERTRARA